MRNRIAAVLVAVLCLSCRSLDHRREDQLARVAKDWCLTIRASQVLPVYPLTEDLQVGDVFLVSSPLEEEVKLLERDGFLPLENVIARIQPTGWQQFYNGSYSVEETSVLPRQWQFPAPPPASAPLTAWSSAPGAAFPSYTFQVKQGVGATLAIPIQSVPVGLSLLATGDAYGTVNISSASTYGLPVIVMSPQVEEWAIENREFLQQFAPKRVTDNDGRVKDKQHYVRTVHRVYVAGGVNVSLISNTSRGGRVDAGASKPIALFDAGSTTEAVNAAANYASMLSSLSQSVASATPGASVTLASASSRGVAMNETFPRPLVIGYLAFDRAIDEGGVLGPPLPTHARVTGRSVPDVTTVYAPDPNTAKIRAWIDADAGNRQKLRDWLQANADSAGVAEFLNGDSYRQLRAKAVISLGIQ
ncbi:MAG TPA: hypothetical protein VEK79_07955 [Thermoanaerobaculia bacterium]|nr:hypothetical protein [Thermoanaerobaculia bacterium]